MTSPVLESFLPLPMLRRGKVREVYEVDAETLLLVASDRVSAFDVVLDQPIPRKGEVLTQVSAFWFERLRDVSAHHMLSANTTEIVERVPALQGCENALFGRAMLCRRTEPVLFECVVRGYVAGSAWKEYRESGTLAGEPLPQGLMESGKLDPPIFSPATKAEEGHDENVTFGQVVEELGRAFAEELRDRSLALYEAGRSCAAAHGIIIADTKFEFGRTADGSIILIDEVLTPDSSRFWPMDQYQAGRRQPSFDKQPLRDYLAELKSGDAWNGDAPGPSLPAHVVRATSERYQEAYRLITGHALVERP